MEEGTYFDVLGKIVAQGEDGFTVDTGTKPKTYYRPWELDWEWADPFTEWLYLGGMLDEVYQGDHALGLYVRFSTNLIEQREAMTPTGRGTPPDYGQKED